MLKTHSRRNLKVLLAQLVLVLATVSATQAQIGMAPIKRLGARITCHVGGESYQLTPDRKLIIEMQFASNDVETQRVFNEVEPYTDLRVRLFTIPVKEDINVQICPSDDGMNYIAFSPAWLQEMYDETSSKWALYAIIAHEIGHYVRAHDRTRVGSDPEIELEADKYAGEVLARMGASLTQARTAYNSHLLRSHHGESHPAVDQRLAAVKEGWLKGKEMRSSVTEDTSTDNASGISKGPVELNHAVHRGGQDLKFKLEAIQFNAHDCVRKAADELTDKPGSHVANNRMYYWTKENNEDRLLLAWTNVTAQKLGWVIVENHKNEWFYRTNSGTDWKYIKRGAEKTKISWDCSGQSVDLFLYVPELTKGWTANDIEYGFGDSN